MSSGWTRFGRSCSYGLTTQKNGSVTMSQKETTHLIGHLGDGESLKGDLPKLAELGRQAFEQKRKKDCLDLTRAILLIDPDNAPALSMRSVIQSEMHGDLEDGRALLTQAQCKEKADRQTRPGEE